MYKERDTPKMVLQCVIILYNLGAQRVEMSQILFTYMPHLSMEGIEILIERLHI